MKIKFECSNDGNLIHFSKVCNFDIDCIDKSDETNCSKIYLF